MTPHLPLHDASPFLFTDLTTRGGGGAAADCLVRHRQPDAVNATNAAALATAAIFFLAMIIDLPWFLKIKILPSSPNYKR